MGTSGSMSSSGGGGGDIWSNLLGSAFSGGGGGGGDSTEVYGTSTFSNILGPLSPTYWMDIPGKKKARKAALRKAGAEAEILETQEKIIKGKYNRDKKLRQLLYGYR